MTRPGGIETAYDLCGATAHTQRVNVESWARVVVSIRKHEETARRSGRGRRAAGDQDEAMSVFPLAAPSR